MTFSKTIKLWRECNKLEQQKEHIKDLPDQLPLLTEKVKKLESVLGNLGGVDFSTLILNHLNLCCKQNDVMLIEIPEKHQFFGDNLIVETIEVNLQGNFTNQLMVVSDLENSELKARLRSLKFQTVYNQITGEHKLQGTLFLQSIRLMPDKSISSVYEKPNF
jgi:hypothetical protein